jgi:uncharacterized repeat protein (TIGR01451 family)
MLCRVGVSGFVLLVASLLIGLLAPSAFAEVHDWNYAGANTNLIGTSSANTVNAVTITSSAATGGTFTSTSVQIQPTSALNGSTTGMVNSSMNASTDNLSSFQTLTVRFSEPVYNVSFTVLDIDGGPTYAGLWNDVVDFGSDAGAPTALITNAAWVSYNSTTGRATAISNQNAVSGNANQANGNIRLTFAGPITFFTVRHYSGPVDDTTTGANETDPAGQVIIVDDVTFTRSARLAISKTSLGGTGTFNFNNSNGFTFTAPSTYTYGTTATSVATVTAGVAVAGTSNTLGIINTATTITETGPTGWIISSTTAACTDSNSAVSGNPASFTAPVSGAAFTIPATNIRAGAVITCAITNARAPTVSVQKITPGTPGGPFSFAATNLAASIAAISTTSTSVTPTTPTKVFVSAGATPVSLTETSPLAWVASGVTCSDANTAVSGNTNPVATSTSGAVTIPAAAVRVGADINCIFTNVNAAPQLAVNKTSSVGTVSAAGTSITYTIAVSNPGNTVLAAIAVTDPIGTVVCPVSGNNTIATLAVGASVNCTVSYVVPQADFNNNGGGDGDIDNTAMASTTYNGTPVSANGSRAVLLSLNPQMLLVKSANTAGPVTAGTNITYRYRVTNTGNITISNVTINDVHNGYGIDPLPGSEVIFNDVAPLGDSSDAAPAGVWGTLAPGDTIDFTGTYSVQQADIDNLQ